MAIRLVNAVQPALAKVGNGVVGKVPQTTGSLGVIAVTLENLSPFCAERVYVALTSV